MSETFSEICAEFIDKPYSEYGTGPDSYGCLGLCYALLKRLGKNLDDSVCQYNGLTLNNFMETWKKDNNIDRLLLEAFDRIGQEIPVSKKLAGDLLIVKMKNGGYFPAICTGNNTIIASYSNAGVRVFLLGKDMMTVVKARRIN